MTARIGTSGWSYDHWSGVLYRPGLPAASRLVRYVEVFDTVELNASHYRWPTEAMFTGWRDRLPDGFAMSVKAHRGLTHFRRLSSPEPWVQRFERCWQLLGDRAGVLLVQLHREQRRDDERLDYFLGRLPESLRVAAELRHPSWADSQVYALLERHRAAWVITSETGTPATTDLVYIRMHGPDPDELYTGSYDDAELRRWADRIAVWQAQNRQVWVYFNNDLGGHAVRNACSLRQLLG